MIRRIGLIAADILTATILGIASTSCALYGWTRFDLPAALFEGCCFLFIAAFLFYGCASLLLSACRR